MKYALILALATFSANAHAGFFSCTSELGQVFVGGVDGEANVTDLRVIEANASPAKESALVLEEISLVKSFKLVAKIELPEESVVYTINAKKNNGVSEATITEQAGESSITVSGTCTIFFKAAN